MRILVADDHAVVRRGVVSLLTSQPGYNLCGEAVDGQDAVEKARALRPDVIVMDVSMPNLNGLEATRTIRREIPEIEILILSQHESAEMVRQAFNAGARGYVVKSSIANHLLNAVEAVGNHESFFDGTRSQISNNPSRRVDEQDILQRSAVLEQALRESEELYRSTFEFAGVGVAHVNPEGRWLRVNPKLCKILGYSQEELLNLRFQDLTHPDDLAADLEQGEKMVSGLLDQYSMEKRYIRKDGSLIWVNLTVSAVRDASKKFKYFISVIEDITARKEAEQARSRLASAEQARFRLAAIVESSDDAIVSKDLNGIITSWNSAAEHIFGYKAEEVIGKSITILIPPELLNEETEFLQRLRNGERIGHYETTRVRKDGKRLNVSLTISPVRDAEGRVVGASKIARDITVQREEQERTRFTLEAANIGTWEWDLISGSVHWSDNMEQVHGQAVGSFGGSFESFLAGVHPDERTRIPQLVQQAISGDGKYHVEYRQIRADGSLGWMEGIGQVIYDNAGKPIRMIGICTDITERKSAEDALRSAHDELEQRVRERTTELVLKNDELTAKSAVIRDLSRRSLQIQDEERRRIAREMHDSVGQLLAAMSMNFAHALNECQKLSPLASKSLFDNAGLLEQATSEVRTLSHLLHPPLLEEAGIATAIHIYVEGFSERSKIHVTCELPEDLGPLPKEVEITLFRIVQEALTNIHRHSASTTATIRMHREDSQVRLEISDAGQGIPLKKLQLVNSSSGSGVGIRGMRERLQQLGGDLQIESASDGTTLTATLPVSSETKPINKLKASQ